MSEILEFTGEARTWVLRRHRILGKGSFGCATLYEDMHAAGRFVVVKDVNLQTMKKEDEMKSLEMEVAILRRSRGHPNIVQFLDYYHDGDFMVYIVMEYCAAGDMGQLEEQLQYRTSHQPESFVASVLIQILAGLHFLHVEQHTLHRDIKPQNLFLCGDEALRIGDFGVSTILEQFGGVAKAVCGSPFYMAPEVCEEKAYDGKADLWSVGVTLYELMVLERPFTARSVPALTRQIIRGEFNPIPSSLPYSTQLVELVQSFLQTSVTSRPTLRRALRSAYVRSHLACVPLSCLESPHYTRLFGEELVRGAVAQRSSRSATVGAGGACGKELKSNNKDNKHEEPSSSARGDVSELEMWLKTSGEDAADALIGARRGSQQVAGRTSPRPGVGVGATTRDTPMGAICTTGQQQQQQQQQRLGDNDDEEVWNDAYEDDFESESSSDAGE
ncbi:protein kinase [Trypanosoma grayi]|uniref:protein kinase n=1 Tax=Trypanosoma grayi TaxID=71804 RepID=UPI0004F43102|nr:protein kinase [Trypanosoma grayi]KEG06651.1 protein kinase [Trypanosoma grayi]